MIIALPSATEMAIFVGDHPVLAAVVLIVGILLAPAVWSRRAERRCAAAAVLAKVLDAVVSVAQLGVVLVIAVVLGDRPNRVRT